MLVGAACSIYLLSVLCPGEEERSSGSFSFPRGEASGLRNALCCFPSCPQGPVSPRGAVALGAPLYGQPLCCWSGLPGAGYEALPTSSEVTPSPCPASFVLVWQKKGAYVVTRSEENVQNCSCSVSLCSSEFGRKLSVGGEQTLGDTFR